MAIFPFPGIPAQKHWPNSYRAKDGNNDNPDNGVIDIFFTGCSIN
jgi:hypothetical protein